MKIIRRVLFFIIAVVVIGTIALVSWATIRAQEATAPALELLQANGVDREGDLLVFRPNSPTTQALIYYPGGLVEPEAYAGTGQGLADQGYLVVIPDMPLNLAFFDGNRADEILTDFPEIETWVIGGHSLGGAMAADYARENTEAVDGLIVYASYPTNQEEFIDFAVPILTIIGSADPGSVNQTAFYDVISDSAERYIIEGGNHRQYADYAYQANDGVATISSAEQQNQIVAATVEFFESLK